MNPEAPSFVPSTFLVPSAVLLRGKDCGHTNRGPNRSRGKVKKKKRRQRKKCQMARKGKKKVLDKDYPPLTETYASNNAGRKSKACKKTDAVWPIEQKATLPMFTPSICKEGLKKTTRVKVKRSKAKYYGLGEFKFNKPLFSCNSKGEETVKQTEGSDSHLDDSREHGVAVEPAPLLSRVVEPTFFDEIRDEKDMYKLASQFVLEDNVSYLGFLLEKFADTLDLGKVISVNNYANETLLTSAIRINAYKSVTLLLSHGAGNDKALGVLAKAEELPLHLCCLSGNVLMLTEILKWKHIYVNRKDCNGNTALHCAVEEDSHACVLALLNHGARVLFNKIGFTPLHLASATNSIQCFKVLLNRSPMSIDRKNSRNETPLFIACKYNCPAAASMLIKEGANMNISNIEMKTPLYAAVECGWIDLVELLLVRGALKQDPASSNPSRKSNKNTWQKPTKLVVNVHRSPLHIAVKNGHFEIIHLLLSNGFDVNKIEATRRESALFALCANLPMLGQSNSLPSCLELLIDFGANVNIECGIKHKMTPLICLLLQGEPAFPLASILIENGADVNHSINGLDPVSFLVEYAQSRKRNRGGRSTKPILQGILFLVENGVTLPEVVGKDGKELGTALFEMLIGRVGDEENAVVRYRNDDKSHKNNSTAIDNFMLDLLIDDDDVDVVFLIRNGTIELQAHMCILIMRLEYFRDYFLITLGSNKNCSDTFKNSPRRVEMDVIRGFEWVQYELSLRYFLEFVYTFGIQWTNAQDHEVEIVLELFSLAEYTRFHSLVECVLERLEQVFAAALQFGRKYANSLYGNVLEYGRNSSYSRLTKFLSTKIRKMLYSKTAEESILKQEQTVTPAVTKMKFALSKLDAKSKLRESMFALYKSINTEGGGVSKVLAGRSNKSNRIVVLKLRGQSKYFSAHRMLLSKRVAYFKKMFSSCMLESHTDTIEIGGDFHDPMVLHYLLLYVYTGSLDPLIQIDHLCILYIFAEQICYDDLVEYLQRRLINSCNIRNIFYIIKVLPIVAISNSVSSFELKMHVFSFVLWHIDQIKDCIAVPSYDTKVQNIEVLKDAAGTSIMNQLLFALGIDWYTGKSSD